MPYTATCHCGSTCLKIPQLPKTAVACNCSFCTKRGVLWSYFQPDEVIVVSNNDSCVYEPSGVNHHYFCGRCGCSTFSKAPDWSSMNESSETSKHRIAVNLWLIDDLDVQALPIEKLDGRNLW